MEGIATAPWIANAAPTDGMRVLDWVRSCQLKFGFHILTEGRGCGSWWHEVGN
jgi:hypothetical protein